MVLLLGAGAVAGIVGSAGGTASLISYPALLAVGIPPLAANVTNSVAFVAAWPGSALGSRPELRAQRPRLLRGTPLIVAGSAAGATLLLCTSAATFDRVVPFLLAFAALALLLQPQISAWLAGHRASSSRFFLAAGLVAVSAYDGYWGAGAGVMTLALLLITMKQEPARSNALKNMLLGVADVTCCVVFVLFWPVDWGAALPMAAGFLAGSMRAGHTESRGGVPGVGPAFGPALVFDGGSDMPHAHFECEGVILVHSAQLFHERHHVRHRAAGQALHADELSALCLGEAGNRARFHSIKITHAHPLRLADHGPVFTK
jgi:uncharacterized protein